MKIDLISPRGQNPLSQLLYILYNNESKHNNPCLGAQGKEANQQVVSTQQESRKIYELKHKTLLLILKISFFQQDDTQTTHSLKEGTIEIIYFLGQNLGWTKSFIYGELNSTNSQIGWAWAKQQTTTNNNRDQTNISTHLREGVYIYLHTLAEFEVLVLRPISDLMLETKLERSKGFNQVLKP